MSCSYLRQWQQTMARAALFHLPWALSLVPRGLCRSFLWFFSWPVRKPRKPSLILAWIPCRTDKRHNNDCLENCGGDWWRSRQALWNECSMLISLEKYKSKKRPPVLKKRGFLFPKMVWHYMSHSLFSFLCLVSSPIFEPVTRCHRFMRGQELAVGNLG